ncbi:unnamed protein product, partial [Amoebophrya sp. A25]
ETARQGGPRRGSEAGRGNLGLSNGAVATDPKRMPPCACCDGGHSWNVIACWGHHYRLWQRRA